MALRKGACVFRLNSLQNAARLLSTSTRPDIAQNNSNYADFPGAKAPYVTELKFLSETSYDPIPIYRVLDNDGHVIDSKEEPNIDNDKLLHMYRTMVQLSQMDKMLFDSQRQGRITFYLTSYGEEGLHVGSAAPLNPQDILFPQYRETGAFLYRGITVKHVVNQCYGTIDDNCKGRQMPTHYGSKEFNIVTPASPLSTQLPQAVGASYALKRQPNNDRCVVGYVGDGAASEGDAFAALNFAATLECPIIFFCRNNGYAISTPTTEQYRGDGIAARGPALGIRTTRVDGTDILAVYNAVKEAREYVIKNNKPMLVEAMAYRVSHHSTSDDSHTYRSVEEIQNWVNNRNPIQKFKSYLQNKGIWNEDADKALLKEARKTVVREMEAAEKKKLPNWREMLLEVYNEIPRRTQNQMKQMEQHLEKYGDKYPLEKFKVD